MGASSTLIEPKPSLLLLCAALGAMVAPGCGGKAVSGAAEGADASRPSTDSPGSDGAASSSAPNGWGGASTSGVRTGGASAFIGGTTASGGTITTAGTTGAGCTGNLEAIQNVSGHELCVAKLVTISGPSGSSDYQIDATEVTRGQYEGWVATNPTLPASSDAACGWKSSSSYAQLSSCMTSSDVCQGPGCDHYPVVCVDWCDAYYYCAALGKRLCGKIGGGSHAWSSGPDSSASQWYWACSSGSANTYPYGNTFEPTYCNAYNCWGNSNDESLPVATLSTCQSSVSGYTGVYDLSGNVVEWEDSCYDINTGVACGLRGGSFNSYSFRCDSDPLQCGGRGGRLLDRTSSDLGFRCCSP